MSASDLSELPLSAAREDQPAPLFTPDQWHRLALHFKLTPRELEMARLICDSCTKETAASLLNISQNTVRMHCRNLFGKLRVHDRVALVDADRRHRVISDAADRATIGQPATQPYHGDRQRDSNAHCPTYVRAGAKSCENPSSASWAAH